MATRASAAAAAARTPQAVPDPLPDASPSRFFDLAVDMLCLAGMDGYFKVINQAWSETLGYSGEELLSRPYLDFVHPDDRDATIAEASKLALGFRTVHFRNRYRCKDGSYRVLAWTAAPVLRDGTIYAGARDVTEEVWAAELEVHHRHEERARILDAIASNTIRPVFQPIVELATGTACGYEALARFTRASKRSPAQWFEDAAACGLQPELELHAIACAISEAGSLPADAFLSINASPDTLVREDFGTAVDGVDGHRLVVEVTEYAAVEDYEPLLRAIRRLRQRGIRLAIDDAGAGFSSLKHIVSLVPEFIKLDVFLTRGLHADPVKRAVVAGMVGVSSQIGARLIAEGAETAEELQALVDLGVKYGQGFYLGKPTSRIESPPAPVRAH